jgi:DNA-binding CsgD family transcriptional regulator
MARTDVLLVQGSTADCEAAVAALVEGRAGVVLAADEADLLPVALAAVEAGFAVVSQRVVEEAASMPALSVEERRLLALIGTGATNGEIAVALDTSVGRVRAASARLARRLGVRGRAGLVTIARSLGI